MAKSHRNLPHFRCLSLDLPFHGENKAVAVEDFEQTAQCLEEQIQHLIKDEPYILIGYSLGGRIAQYYALQAKVKIGHLKAVILEGANLGLQSGQEKQSRLVNDNMWAERFSMKSLKPCSRIGINNLFFSFK